MTRTEVLNRYGIIDSPNLVIEPLEADMWRVRISADGNRISELQPIDAMKLSEELDAIGEDRLAKDIVAAAEKAAQYGKSGTPGGRGSPKF